MRNKDCFFLLLSGLLSTTLALAQTPKKEPRKSLLRKKEVHAAQEGGVDKPYKLEVGLLSDWFSSSVTTQSQDSKATSGTGNFMLDLQSFYFLNDKFGIGGSTEYAEVSSKIEGVVVTRRLIRVLPGCTVKFASIDKDVFVPFVRAYGGATLASTTSSKDSDSNVSNTAYGVGGALGLHIFLDSNIALSPEFSLLYETYGNKKSSKTQQTGVKETHLDMHFLKIGFAVFL